MNNKIKDQIKEVISSLGDSKNSSYGSIHSVVYGENSSRVRFGVVGNSSASIDSIADAYSILDGLCKKNTNTLTDYELSHLNRASELMHLAEQNNMWAVHSVTFGKDSPNSKSYARGHSSTAISRVSEAVELLQYLL